MEEKGELSFSFYTLYRKIKRKNKNERNLLTYDSVRCIIEYALQKRAANKKEKNKTVDFIDQSCYD